MDSRITGPVTCMCVFWFFCSSYDLTFSHSERFVDGLGQYNDKCMEYGKEIFFGHFIIKIITSVFPISASKLQKLQRNHSGTWSKSVCSEW